MDTHLYCWLPFGKDPFRPNPLLPYFSKCLDRTLTIVDCTMVWESLRRICPLDWRIMSRCRKSAIIKLISRLLKSNSNNVIYPSIVCILKPEKNYMKCKIIQEGHTPRKQFRYINLTFKIVNHDHAVALDYITKFVF